MTMRGRATSAVPERLGELRLAHRRAALDVAALGLGVELVARALGPGLVADRLGRGARLVGRLHGAGRFAQLLPAGLGHLHAVALRGPLDALERFGALLVA